MKDLLIKLDARRDAREWAVDKAWEEVYDTCETCDHYWNNKDYKKEEKEEKMSNRTALDILFQEIKESKAVMPDALFGYFEMVYNKVKEIETKQIKNAYRAGQANILNLEDFYKETYEKE